MSSRIQHRRGTRAAWIAANPVLLAGEPGYETDTGGEKRGDGATAWTALPYANPSRGSVSLTDFGADRTGVTPSTTALRNAIAAAQALAQAGYNPSQGARVYVPSGRWLLDGKITVPEGVVIEGDGPGFGGTSFNYAAGFPDNCVFEPANILLTQEFAGLRGFSLYGPGGNTPSANQANGGVATTVATAVTQSAQTAGFSLVAAGSISAYASNGTLLVGTQRVIYQTTNTGTKTFGGCYVISGSTAAINIGDAISAVTTDNIRAVQWIGVSTPSYLRDLLLSSCTGETLLIANCNALEVDNVTANYSNRDCILHLGPTRASNFYRAILGQYPGVSDTGGTFAGMHLLGQSGIAAFQGFVSIKGFYSELTAHNAIGLWIQNMGSVDADCVNLEGGTNSGGTSYATQVCVQIDSSQASPLTQDGSHTANISLRNLGCGQIGRVLLKDNVRGYSTPANTTTPGSARTRYDTEDNPTGLVTILTASNATWPIPANAQQLRITCVGGGGGGGGGGSSSATATQVGGAGGSSGVPSTQIVAVGAATTLNVTIGGGGSGGGGGAASGNPGTNGNNGGATTVTGTGISVRGGPGGKGLGGAANSAVTVGPVLFGATVAGSSTTVGSFAGNGGAAASVAGLAGGDPIAETGGAGGGGGATSATLGGAAGNAGTAIQGGAGVGAGGSGTTAGGTGANAAATAYGAGGGGGGGGAWNGGTGPGAGGTGGTGAPGVVIIEVIG